MASKKKTSKKRATTDSKTPIGRFKDILNDEVHFPSFNHLPNETPVDRKFWKVESRQCKPKYTWFFLGEITDSTDALRSGPMFRNRIVASDRAGKSIPVLFYPQNGQFDFRHLKKGHTICILLAEKHSFLDYSTGLRVENLDTVKVVQCGLKDLVALSRTYAERKNSKCWYCSKSPTQAKTKKEEKETCSSSHLKVCSSCEVACYCDKACQTADWKKHHRKWCKVLPDFLLLTKTDLSEYNQDYWFALVPDDTNPFEEFLESLLDPF